MTHDVEPCTEVVAAAPPWPLSVTLLQLVPPEMVAVQLAVGPTSAAHDESDPSPSGPSQLDACQRA